MKKDFSNSRQNPIVRISIFWCFVLIVLMSISCASTDRGKPAASARGSYGSTSGGKAAPTVSLDEAIRQAADDITEKLPEGSSLAIVQFKSESDSLSDYIIDELTYALVGSSLKVADRTNLDAARRELNFQASGEVDEKTAQSIGKFLGVEYEGRGEFILTGDTYRFRVNTIIVKSSVIVATTVRNVRNDTKLQRMITTLDSNRVKTKAAKY